MKMYDLRSKIWSLMWAALRFYGNLVQNHRYWFCLAQISLFPATPISFSSNGKVRLVCKSWNRSTKPQDSETRNPTKASWEMDDFGLCLIKWMVWAPIVGTLCMGTVSVCQRVYEDHRKVVASWGADCSRDYLSKLFPPPTPDIDDNAGIRLCAPDNCQQSSLTNIKATYHACVNLNPRLQTGWRNGQLLRSRENG